MRRTASKNKVSPHCVDQLYDSESELIRMACMRFSKLIVCCLLLIAVYLSGTACHFNKRDPDKRSKKKNESVDTSTDRPSSAIDQSPDDQTEARGGIIDGNTGELITTEYNPWFLGKETVSYCLASGEDFSLPKAEAARAIKSAFETWSHVFTLLQKYGSVPSDFDLPPEIFPLEIASSFMEVECDKNPPLVFKLGLIDKDVSVILPFTATHTIGFAKRTSYNEKTGQGRGFIWVTPDQGDSRYQGGDAAPGFWKHPHRFQNVIAHEIGHVLGFNHVPGTVMDARLPAAIVVSPENWLWDGSEFSWMREFPGDFCGTLAFSENAALSKKLFDQGDVEGMTLCTKYAPGIGGQSDKYALELSLKRDADILQTLVVDVSIAENEKKTVTGQYLRKKSSNQKSYAGFNFFDFIMHSMFKGVLRAKSGGQPLLFERTRPGSFAIRIPNEERWELLVLIDTPHWESNIMLFKILGD